MAKPERRAIDVFFYGLFMDDALLREKGFNPLRRRRASVENFSLHIGARATLVPASGGVVHGLVYSLTHDEIDCLYAEPSLRLYRPEAVLAKLEDGSMIPVLCFNLPAQSFAEERNLEYAAKLKDLAARVGLPAHYVHSI